VENAGQNAGNTWCFNLESFVDLDPQDPSSTVYEYTYRVCGCVETQDLSHWNIEFASECQLQSFSCSKGKPVIGDGMGACNEVFVAKCDEFNAAVSPDDGIGCETMTFIVRNVNNPVGATVFAQAFSGSVCATTDPSCLQGPTCIDSS
jgi:hypothetical protein